MTQASGSRVRSALSILSVVGFAWGAAIFATGGLDLAVGGERLRSHQPLHGFAVAAVALVARAFLHVRQRGNTPPVWTLIARATPWVAGAVASLTLATGIRYGTYVAGGSDSYGYVSEARLLAQGRLSVRQPIAAAAPWPNADSTFAPLGYRPGTVPGTIVPTYPPGLPLAMAAALGLAGEKAAYYVVPLLGMLAVWLTYRLGARLETGASGAMAAALVATSPIFLNQLVQPLSDVPALAWMLAALVLAARETVGAAFGAGLAAGLAVLTRPNLLPIVIPIAVYLFVCDAGRPSRWRRPAVFAAGVAPVVGLLALLQWVQYGSPWRSGYPSPDTMFRLEHVLPNLARYPRWMLASETPALLLAILVPVVARHRSPGSWPIARPLAWLCTSAAAILLVTYLLYPPFDDWSYLRFLLPVVVMLAVFASAVVVAAVQKLPGAVGAATLVLACAVVGWSSIGRAAGLDVFQAREAERKYVDAGAWVDARLPSNAAVLAHQHSGSIRHYSGRLTLRWDNMPPDWFDRAIAYLEARGYRPYLLLEATEEPVFRERFSGRSRYGALDDAPIVRLGVVRIYDCSRVAAAPGGVPK